MKKILFLSLLLMLTLSHSDAQRRKSKKDTKKDISLNDSLYSALKWRNIGPFRGGRSVAVSGVKGDELTYYMGSTGGGVWKTTDAGENWKNISDGFFKTGSVGDIAVSSSDPNIIYVGMGEHAVRGVMTSYGDGVYKSYDAGKTWEHLGLELTRHISDVIIHPTNPDIVYVAAQGAVHGETNERGVYKSIDGGKTWKKTLFVNKSTGASSLRIDPSNPRILYAAMWDHIRYPWQVRSGGEGSGIYKSNDAGETWNKLDKGLPKMMGKIGLAVSPVKTDRIWAVVEAEKGGVYRSDDAGKTWSLICSDRITITRSWYYMEIFADPKDEETVYVLNAPALRSIDGGKSFKPMPVGHGDTHDLWINPDNPANMILGDDGGAEISFNTGASWSTLNNQPTAQFYRVNTDNQYPYQVYGGQQDNSSVIIDSKSVFGGIEEKNWTYGPGCESAYLAFDPDNPRYVLGGCYQGYISLLDRKLQILKDVMEYPNVGLGTTPTDLKYRFNWNAPIVSNPLKPTEIYHGGNALFMTTDWGYGWKKISDDLTRNDKSKQLVGGGPITNEGAGGENYNTIMYVAASPHKDGEIWVGSDDGLLHKTTDKGNNWTEVTPPGLGETMINSIELSPHDASTAYVVSTKYKFNDFTPMIHRTTDGGKSWQKITNGIPYGDYVRVVREDKKRKGLLYAGSERGLYISLDAGSSWSKFQLNLPIVPINDLTIADNDLVAATAGRAFWILDNLSPIQQLLGKEEMKTSQLIAPEKAIRDNLGRSSDPNVGQNPLPGAIIDYWLGEVTDSSNVRLEIRNSDGQVIRRYSNKPEKLMPYPGGPTPEKALPMKKGINRINWNFREDMIPHVPGVFVLGNYQGSEVMPGEYMLRLIVDKDSSEVKLNVAPHPGVKADQSDFRQQYELSKNIDKMVSSIHESVREIRSATEQIRAVQKRVESIEEADTLMSLGNSIIKDMEEWQSVLIQPKQKTFQDVINFPNQLNTELLNLRGRIEGNLPEVTEGAKNRMDDLSAQWTDQRKALDEIIVKLGDFNKLYKELDLPVIITNIKN